MGTMSAPCCVHSCSVIGKQPGDPRLWANTKSCIGRLNLPRLINLDALLIGRNYVNCHYFDNQLGGHIPPGQEEAVRARHREGEKKEEDFQDEGLKLWGGVGWAIKLLKGLNYRNEGQTYGLSEIRSWIYTVGWLLVKGHHGYGINVEAASWHEAPNPVRLIEMRVKSTNAVCVNLKPCLKFSGTATEIASSTSGQKLNHLSSLTIFELLLKCY